MNETIPHWLTKQAYLAPNKTAIELVNGEVITFHTLMMKSQQFARQLFGKGVRKNTHIGILSTNHVDMVIAIHALSYLGAVSVLLNTRLTNEELNYQINDADVQFVIGSNECVIGTGVGLDVPVIPFSQVKDLAEKNVELNQELNLHDIFTIIYTSGTTGSPKGVVHTYGNHWWSAISSALNLGIHDDDKWLIVLPIFHVGGLSTLIKSVIYGMGIYLMEKFNEQVVHDAIMERGVTIASTVTVMLQRLVHLLGESHYPKTFRCMLLGGGPAPVPLLEMAKERKIPVFQSYGMTETASQIVTLSPNDALRKIGSAGKPLGPAQLHIHDADKHGVGEIMVKGPMVTTSYFHNQDATDRTIQSGWLSTGDLGYVDDEGFLYVVDRRKDLIISGGENIYPTEIEEVLSDIEGVKEVGVTGVYDDTWGQVPIACIVRGDLSLCTKDILQHAEEKLAKYKLPKQIIFVEELPRNASNKLVRRALVDLIPRK